MSYDSHNKAQLYSHTELKTWAMWWTESVFCEAHHSPPHSMKLCLPFPVRLFAEVLN